MSARGLTAPVRRILATPSFAASVVLILALALGGAGGLLSLLNAVVLRPLPVERPQELVVVYPALNQALGGIPLATMRLLSERQRALTGLCGFSRGALSIEIERRLSRHPVEAVSDDCFTLLGVRPHLGRLIGTEDRALTEQAEPVVVLGHDFWRREFGGSASVIGRSLRVQEKNLTVVGVLPSSFGGLTADLAADLVVPLGLQGPLVGVRRVPALYMFGRLAPSRTLADVRQEMSALWAPTWDETNPSTAERPRSPAGDPQFLRVEPFASGVSLMRTRYEAPLYLLVGLAVALWGLAVVNVGALFLVRAFARAPETAILYALGAGRRRVARAFLAEGFVLAACSGVLALLVASWLSLSLAGTLWTVAMPLTMSVTPDLWTMAVVGTATAITGLMAALPALLVSMRVPHPGAGDRGRTVAARTSTWRRIVVLVQVSASVGLLVTAALFVRSLDRLRGIDPGYRTTNVLWTPLEARPDAGELADPVTYLRTLIDRIEAIPAVQHAAVSTVFPEATPAQVVSLIPAFRADPDGPLVSSSTEYVSPGFFKATATNLVAGRDLQWQDATGQPLVAVINEALAGRLFGHESALGRRFRIESRAQAITVVGVVRTVSRGDVRIADAPSAYLPVLQQGPSFVTQPNVVMALTAPADVLLELRDAVEPLGRSYVTEVRTVAGTLDLHLARERALSTVSSGLALLGLLIATLGLYALLDHSVVGRAKELGIRSALGATAARLQGIILAEGMALAGIGVLLGIPLAFVGARVAAPLLFQASLADPWVIGGAGAILATTALFASVVPGRRAARIDVIDALRTD